jgi:hypothetical protein
MRHFSVNLGIRGSEEEENDMSSRTLMISGVPDTYCTKEFMHRHVTEAYRWVFKLFIAVSEVSECQYWVYKIR